MIQAEKSIRQYTDREESYSQRKSFVLDFDSKPLNEKDGSIITFEVYFQTKFEFIHESGIKKIFA